MTETIPDLDKKRIVESAVKAFGHIKENTVEDCLILRIMQLERFASERNAALSANAWQAGEISRLNLRLKDMEAKRDGFLRVGK